MKRRLAFCIAVLGFAAGSARAAEPPVEVRVEHLSPQLAERIKSYAARGKTALIRYLNGTRMIHNLRLDDVLPK